MKKIITLCLLAGLLISATACAGEDAQKGNTTGATTTAAPKYDDDHPMVNSGLPADLTGYITVPELSAIKVSAEKLNEKWLEEEKMARESYAEFKDTAEGYVAADGDLVNIHYKGYSADPAVELTEETVANMTNIAYDDEGKLEEGYDLVLGSNSFIGAYENEAKPEKNNPGFEEQLVGLKAGENRTITVTFPDDYSNSKELQGVVIKFDVTVNKIQNVILPELTDEMVSEYTSEQYKDVASFKAYILEYYTAQLAYEAITEASTFHKYPEDLLDQYIKDYVADYIDYMYAGEELTDAEKKVIFDEQYDDAKENAEGSIESQMVLEVLFARMNITLTYKEYTDQLTAEFEEYYYYYYYYYGLTTVEDVEEYFGEDQLITQFKYDKLLKLLPGAVTVE